MLAATSSRPASIATCLAPAMRTSAWLPLLWLLPALACAQGPQQARVLVERIPAQAPRTAPPSPPHTPRPQAPYRMRDHCPFEYGCNFGVWQACEPLRVQRAPEAGAPVRYRLAALERFRALRADLVLTRLGRVRVEYPMNRDPSRGWPSLPVGTEVVVFKAYAEAGYGIWANGREWGVESFWHPTPSPRWPGRLLQRPEMTWWVEIETLDGRHGWLGLRNTLPEGDGFNLAEAIRWDDGPVTDDAPDCEGILRQR